MPGFHDFLAVVGGATLVVAVIIGLLLALASVLKPGDLP